MAFHFGWSVCHWFMKTMLSVLSVLFADIAVLFGKIAHLLEKSLTPDCVEIEEHDTGIDVGSTGEHRQAFTELVVIITLIVVCGASGVVISVFARVARSCFTSTSQSR